MTSKDIHEQVYDQLFYGWYTTVEGHLLDQTIPQLSTSIREELQIKTLVISGPMRRQVMESLL